MTKKSHTAARSVRLIGSARQLTKFNALKQTPSTTVRRPANTESLSAKVSGVFFMPHDAAQTTLNRTNAA